MKIIQFLEQRLQVQGRSRKPWEKPVSNSGRLSAHMMTIVYKFNTNHALLLTPSLGMTVILKFNANGQLNNAVTCLGERLVRAHLKFDETCNFKLLPTSSVIS